MYRCVSINITPQCVVLLFDVNVTITHLGVNFKQLAKHPYFGEINNSYIIMLCPMLFPTYLAVSFQLYVDL